MKKIIPILLLFLATSCNQQSDSADKKPSPSPIQVQTQPELLPTISFTFDDGITRNILNYRFKTWNQMILDALEKDSLKAVFFVTGVNKLDERGKFLLKSWAERGHRIANHTFSHPNFNSEKVTLEEFEWEFLKTDSIIKTYKNHIPLFRFPFLKEGKDSTKVNGFRNFLQAQNYKNGHVTIDASDWYVNDRLIKKLRKDSETDIEKFKAFYLKHLFDRAEYYEKLAFEITGRHIPHTILLHHNLTSALFLEDLIQHFKTNNWKVVDADVAFQDKIFDEVPKNIPAGESLIWALAKQSGAYENQLRYPAEDSRYEKSEMDSLGL